MSAASGTSSQGAMGRAWLVVALLWFVGCSNYLTRNMIVTMHGSIVATIPMTETEFGLLISAFVWIYAVANPVGGFFADRFGCSRVIVISLLLWSLFTALTAFATTFAELAALRVAMGLSQACYLPAAGALIVRYHRGPTRSFATGLHMTGVVLGAAIGGFGGWLAERQGWHFAFALVGIAGLAYGGALALVLRDPPEEEQGPAAPASPTRLSEAVAALGGNLSYWIAFVYWGLIGAVSWVMTSWMPTFLHDQYHLAQGRAGISANGFFFVTELAGLLVGGAWADRWGRTNARARLYVPVLGLCASAPTFWFAAHSSAITWTFVNLASWGFGSGFAAANMMPVLCLFVERRYQATAFGLLNSASALFGGVAIYGAGVLRDLGANLSHYLTLAGINVIACAGLLLLVRTGRTREEPAPG